MSKTIEKVEEITEEAGDNRVLLWCFVAFAAIVGLMANTMKFHGTVVLTFVVLIGVFIALALYYLNLPRWFALAIGAVLLVEKFEPPQAGETVLLTARGFFGVNRVVLGPNGKQMRLYHGATVHGIQSRDPDQRDVWDEPMAYYHRTGPLGMVFDHLNRADQIKNAAIVGLGTGATAYYRQDGQQFTFYEIDPLVKQIAETPEYFTYLQACGAAGYSIVLGDGRLKLAEADASYDLMVFDAFSSDAIPTHLLTREALAIYLEKLEPQGVLAFHISNKHLDLEPVLADLAKDAGVVCLTCQDANVSEEQAIAGKTPATYVAMARKMEDFAGLDQHPLWKESRQSTSGTPWTDDFSNILDVLTWNRPSN